MRTRTGILGLGIAVVIALCAMSAAADQFYFMTEDGAQRFGPFEYKPGTQLQVGEIVYTLATSQRQVGEATIKEIYLRDDKSGEVNGPFPLVDDTVVKVGDIALKILTSPFTRWKIRRAISLVMWQWEIENGSRIRSYNRIEGKKYVVVTARLTAKDAFNIPCAYFSQVHFAPLFKQLFSINVNDDEFASKLTEIRLGANGPKAFMAAVVPKRGYASCFFMFAVPDDGSLDRLLFEGETYMLPDFDKKTYDQIRIGSEIWEEMPNRQPRGAINPDNQGTVLVAAEKPADKPVATAPEKLEPMGDSAAYQKSVEQGSTTTEQSDVEARKAAIRNRMSRTLERRRLKGD